MRCSTLLVIFTGVLLYLVLGALVFRALEAPLEEKAHAKLTEETSGFLFNNSCVDLKALNDYVEVKLDLSRQEPLTQNVFYLEFNFLFLILFY